MAKAMKVLVIGMNPSTKPMLKNRPSSTFKKLEEWMDKCNIHYFSFCNTFDTPCEAKFDKVDKWRLIELSTQSDKIIALGGFVSTTLNKLGIDHFKMPHPSPRNRLLNDKEYEKSMIKQCRKFLK